MKKMSKRIMAMAFAVLMVISLIPAKPVSAASLYYPKKLTAYETKGGTSTISIVNLPKGVRLKSVKSSDTDVINITSIGYDSFEENGKTIRSAYITYQARSTGKANVTFKIKNSKKTIKVTVKPYVNPVKSVGIFGVKVNNSTNLKNLTKKWSSTYIDLDGKQKSKNIKVVAAKGWKVASIAMWPSNGENDSFEFWQGNGFKGTRTAKIKLPGEGSYTMSVDMYNSKTDSLITLQYHLYY